MKHTLLQYFEWYLPNDSKHWQRLLKESSKLSKIGFSRIWLPPAYKGQAGKDDVGYGVYDLYDLGEFNQKGSIATKYGTKDEYIKAIKACQKEGMEVIADIVLNHKMGADEKETIQATEKNWDNRNEDISELKTVEVWTKYTFPGRNKKYSDFVWDWTCFDGTDFNARTQKTSLLEFEGKQWDQNVSQEDGNFDFIMGDDIDFTNQKVMDELYHWGQWYYEIAGMDGYRIDAIKSISSSFFQGWLAHQRELSKKDAFAVGEYWSGDVNELTRYLTDSEYCMTLFDVPLHFHFMEASQSNGQYDLRKIFEQTLWNQNRDYSVAFVDNHDTQPGQALESWVQPWFKLHAYSYILLRDNPNPCVFYGDLYGIPHNSIKAVQGLPELIWIRKNILGDEIEDHWDKSNAIGWIVKSEHPVVVCMSIQGKEQMEFYIEHGNTMTMIDILNPERTVILDENGKGVFSCDEGSCNIYIEKEVFEKMTKELKI